MPIHGCGWRTSHEGRWNNRSRAETSTEDQLVGFTPKPAYATLRVSLDGSHTSVEVTSHNDKQGGSVAKRGGGAVVEWR